MIDIKLIKQTSLNDCGVACLAMIINYNFKTTIDLEQIKFEQDFNEEMLNFLDLFELGKKYSLFGEAFKVDNEILEIRDKTPFIAQVINQEGVLHFVVVNEITKKTVQIFDPGANKQQTITIKNFENIFASNVLIFKPDKTAFKNNNKLNLKGEMKLIVTDFITYFVLISFSTLLFIFDSRFIKFYGNDLSNSEPNKVIFLMFFAIFIINIILKEMGAIFLKRIREKLHKEQLIKFLNFQSNSTKVVDSIGILSQINYSTNYLSYILIPLVPMLLVNLISLFFIYFISSITIWLMLIHNFIIIILRLFFKTNEKVNENNSLLQTLIWNFKKIQMNSQEISYHKAIINNAKKEIEKIDFDSFKLIETIVDKILVLLIYYFAWNDLKNQIMVFESLIMIMILRSINQENIKQITNFINGWQKFKSTYLKLNKLFNLKTDVDIQNIKKIEYSIEGINNCFEYGIHIVSTNSKILKSLIGIEHIEMFNPKINNHPLSSVNKISVRNKTLYFENPEIKYSTIFANIFIDREYDQQIFENKLVIDLIKNNNIKLERIINQQTVTEREQEVIGILNVLLSDKELIIIDFPFKHLDKNSVLEILKFRQETYENTIIVINDLFKN